MEQLRSEQASLSTLKRNLDGQLAHLMRRRSYYGYGYVPGDRTIQSFRDQLDEVNSRLSQINKIIRDSDRELVTSMTVMPTDTVIDMSTLLNIFHINIILNIISTMKLGDIIITIYIIFKFITPFFF